MFPKRNPDIREVKGKIPAWIIAERLGIHEKTFYSWLNQELAPERKKQIVSVINDLKHELQQQGA